MLRRFTLQRPWLAIALLALAVAARVVVPAGYMPHGDGADASGKLMVMVCTEFGSRTVAIDVPGMADPRGDAPMNADQPCSFSSAGLAWIGGVGPLVLSIALAFILALGFAPLTQPCLPQVAHMRPPLRGPPLTF